MTTLTASSYGPNVLSTAAPELARRELLAGLERQRVAADQGRAFRRRYGDMRARIVRVVEPDRVLVEVSGADWQGAASPSRGEFGADHAIVRVLDAHPRLLPSTLGSLASYAIDRAAPVQLLLEWRDATTVRLVDHDDCPAVIEGGHLRGLPREYGLRHPLPHLERGPVRLRAAGELVTVVLTHERRARPATPLNDLAEDEYQAKRRALPPFAAREELDRQRETERERLADWQREGTRPGPYPFDRCPLTARFPDGFTIRDSQ